MVMWSIIHSEQYGRPQSLQQALTIKVKTKHLDWNEVYVGQYKNGVHHETLPCLEFITIYISYEWIIITADVLQQHNWHVWKSWLK